MFTCTHPSALNRPHFSPNRRINCGDLRYRKQKHKNASAHYPNNNNNPFQQRGHTGKKVIVVCGHTGSLSICLFVRRLSDWRVWAGGLGPQAILSHPYALKCHPHRVWAEHPRPVIWITRSTTADEGRRGRWAIAEGEEVIWGSFRERKNNTTAAKRQSRQLCVVFTGYL